MNRPSKTNLAASVRQKLLNLSRESGEDFGLILTRYGLERLLYRLTKSKYAGQFILKGAALFVVWTENSHRPTRDIDFLGYGDSSDTELIKIFQDICQVKVKDDGLLFDPESINVDEIREDREYQGKRVTLLATLSSARIHVQIDIGFGDVVTPGAEKIEYPTILAFPAPKLLAYPRETVIAEKLQAMVDLGIANSRMKDFFDIWMISREFSFKGATLSKAIAKTFERRKTEIPKSVPLALSPEFVDYPDKIRQWDAFLERNGLSAGSNDFSQVISDLSDFIMPPLQTAQEKRRFDKTWAAGGPWITEE